MTISEALALAIQHHQAGRLQAAEQVYRHILAVEPNHADAFHLLGVIAHQIGKHAIAVEYIARSISLKGNVADFHNNLGVALNAQGKRHDAIACFRRALDLKRDYADAHNNLGNALWDQGELDEAVVCYRSALALKPMYAEAHSNLGNALRGQGKLDEAVACYRRALELKPDYADAHNNLGNALWDQGRLDDAVACYHRALALKPDYAEAYSNLGSVSRVRGRLDEAVACFRRAVEYKPEYAEAYSNLGNALRDWGKLEEAVACCRRAVDLKPDSAEVHNNLGSALQDQSRLDEAAACFRRALDLKPDFAEAHNNLGNALWDQGKVAEAAACYRRALDLKPDFAEAHNNLGNALRDQGQLDQAVACYRRALDLKPDYTAAHNNLGVTLLEMGDLQAAAASLRAALRHDSRYALAHFHLAGLLGGKLPDQDLVALRQLLADPDLTPAQRLNLHFGLAQVLDARGEYAEAAEHLEHGNALQLSEWRKCGQAYDPQEHEMLVTRMIRLCTPEFFERVRGFGLDRAFPVFVVGLPRTGTTLIEQILASHSRVHGAGELRLVRQSFAALPSVLGRSESPFDCLPHVDATALRRLAEQHEQRLQALARGQADRVVDKMPDNYLYLGLLAALFPHAVFIHCRRDLRDVAVSCWMTRFQEVRWANDRQHLASRVHAYERLMAHWRKVLPMPLFEVDYEETVADLEGVARKLVAWCGLAWEPACLDFHRTKRPVKTASAVQVRRPVYKTSMGRWKHYVGSLGSLFTQLESTGR